MGYNCAAAINLKVDGIESQILTKEKTEFLKTELASLRSRQVLVKKMNHNIKFFDSLVYYLSFTSDENKISEHSKLGTLFSYSGDYQLDEYIFKYDIYVGSPIQILELYILCFTISRKFPESKIELGMGDAGVFWSDIELKNGEIVKISSEYGGDDGDGFICNQFEIRQLFLGLNYLWLEENNTIKEDLKNYFHQKNNEIFLAEFEDDPFLLEYADEWMKKDRELVLKLVKKEGYVIEYADESLQGDREIVLEALKSNCRAFAYLSEEFKKDRELVLNVVKEDGFLLEYADETLKADNEIAIEALKNSNSRAFEFISDALKNDKEIVLCALQNDLFGDKIIDLVNKDFLKDVSLLKEAIIINKSLFKYLEPFMQSNKELALLALNQNGTFLKYCGIDLQDDFEVVMNAVQNDGNALLFASKNLKKDSKIVYEAVKNDGRALLFASTNLKKDSKIVYEAVKNDGRALLYAAAIFRDIEDYVFLACETYPESFKILSDRIKSSKDLLKKILKINLECLQFFPKEIKHDKVFLAEILSDYPQHVIIEEYDYFEVWMTVNLDVEKFKNGDLINEIESPDEWFAKGELDQAAYCYYNNNKDNANKLGKMYNHAAVNDKRGLAPKGWRVTSSKDWSNLIDKVLLKGTSINNVDQNKVSLASKLKSSVFDSKEIDVEENQKESIEENKADVLELEVWNGNNEIGLNILPGGCREVYHKPNDFIGFNESSVFWCSNYISGYSFAYCFKIDKEFKISTSLMGQGAYVRVLLNLGI